MVQEDTYRPEADVSMDEALESVESTLSGALRGVRTRLMPTISSEQPTRVEKVVQDAPIIAAGVAAGAGLALGLVVRRFVPRGLRK